jgi:hypothetical protein
MLGVICCAAVCHLAATCANRHPDSVFARGWQTARKVAVEHCPLYRLGKIASSRTTGNPGELEDQDQVCAPDEPHPVDALLPDPAKLIADWQPYETIHVLENTDKQSSCDSVPEFPLPGVLTAPSVTHSACQVPPLCPTRGSEIRELLPVMPRPDKSGDSEADRSADEEQEESPTDPMAEAKAVQERLRHILQSWATRARVDTLEFRPSDARPGEFDRISF